MGLIISITFPTDWLTFCRKISLSLAKSAVRFFSLGANCGRHFRLRPRTRRYSNPRNVKLPPFARSTIRLFSSLISIRSLVNSSRSRLSTAFISQSCRGWEIDDSSLPFHDRLVHLENRFLRRPLRSVSIRPRLEVSFEDRFQNELECSLDHTVTNGRNGKNADLGANCFEATSRLLSLRPDDLLTIPRMALSIDERFGFPLPLYPSYEVSDFYLGGFTSH